jgi:putative tricarboxylic transport membrane protein
MDVLNNLAEGFGSALLLQNVALAFVGVTIGTLVGVLPGLGPATTLALLLPVTYAVDATGALVLFAGIYYGSMYGGSTTAILMNVPGETSSVPTTLEGYPMARRGRGGAALATAAIGSFVAGTIATIGITFLAPVMSEVGQTLQPAEYFAIMVFAFVTVTSLVGSSVVKGMASLFIGLSIGVVGIDNLTGQTRYTFDVPNLNDGIPLVAVAVGLFAVSEALNIASRRTGSPAPIVAVSGRVWMNKEEWKRSWKPWLRGTFLGFPIGALPAGGAEIPTFLSYNIEKRLSKHPKEWGKGAIEGVAGPEAANNAAFSGTLIPLLTLGIPTSATAGVLLIAFQIYNIQPGPLLFEGNSALVWTLIASLYIGNVMLLVLNLPMIKVWVKLLSIPEPLMTAGILVFATLGVWAISQSVFDVLLAYAAGLLGFFLRRSGFPIAPIILGSILGPLLEMQFRRAMSFSQGDWTVFVTRPVSASILGLALLALILPSILQKRKKMSPVQ